MKPLGDGLENFIGLRTSSIVNFAFSWARKIDGDAARKIKAAIETTTTRKHNPLLAIFFPPVF